MLLSMQNCPHSTLFLVSQSLVIFFEKTYTYPLRRSFYVYFLSVKVYHFNVDSYKVFLELLHQNQNFIIDLVYPKTGSIFIFLYLLTFITMKSNLLFFWEIFQFIILRGVKRLYLIFSLLKLSLLSIFFYQIFINQCPSIILNSISCFQLVNIDLSKKLYYHLANSVIIHHQTRLFLKASWESHLFPLS